MKYVVILGDGMAGYPMPDRGNKTCLQLANTPFFDELAKKSTIGLAKTVPDGYAPGSDVANLSVMGYDPKEFYTGRSPLEAASIGIPLADDDVTYRCNLVTLSEEAPYEAKRMIDYSSGEITTQEARELIGALKQEFDKPPFTLYAGISYRHCLVARGGKTGSVLTPPHDITDRPVAGFLPKGAMGETLLAMMKRSYEILNDHPVNRARRAAGSAARSFRQSISSKASASLREWTCWKSPAQRAIGTPTLQARRTPPQTRSSTGPISYTSTWKRPTNAVTTATPTKRSTPSNRWTAWRSASRAV